MLKRGCGWNKPCTCEQIQFDCSYLRYHDAKQERGMSEKVRLNPETSESLVIVLTAKNRGRRYVQDMMGGIPMISLNRVYAKSQLLPVEYDM